jgi:hypothetical protein
LYPLQKTIGDKFLSRLTIRPRFVGLAARPASHSYRHAVCLAKLAALPRGYSGASCSMTPKPRTPAGARGLRSTPWGSWCSTGGTGSAGEAGRRAPPKRYWGFPRRGSRTCHDSPRRCSGLSNTSDTRLRCASPTKRGRKAQDTKGTHKTKKHPARETRRDASHSTTRLPPEGLRGGETSGAPYDR